MTFEVAEFYKHQNGIDSFIQVIKILPDEGDGIIRLKVYWLTQGIYHYWYCPNLDKSMPSSAPSPLDIKKELSNRWHHYTPKGDIKYDVT